MLSGYAGSAHVGQDGEATMADMQTRNAALAEAGVGASVAQLEALPLASLPAEAFDLDTCPYRAVTIITTRRFWARPSSLALSAIGRVSPHPRSIRLPTANPRPCIIAATAVARCSDRRAL